ncbi:phage shock protein C (PspC) family protein [Propionicimonas paludicola]|uniref:Phage shock protein C (PspC) family protein n=1 Tax=Propionicimonas paludicola TaxID=185243 RepID=A0A2A9CQ72_9ACTN|nr:PspC domain-containing protein [Propionicimonas paludicola]PFG15810.1 phage shock protein C (PspC) family protein [Propionicimonas paludicola]
MPDNLPVLITRPADTKMLAGVCAGVARRLGVDPTVVRVAAVLAAIFLGGLGIVAYLAGIALMPKDGQQVMPVQRWLPFTRSWPMAGVVVAVFAVSAVLLYAGGFSGVGIGPALIIFAIWFFGFRKRQPGASGHRPAEPTPFERASDAWRVRLAEQQTPGFENPGLLPSATTAMPPAQPAAFEQRWEQPYTNQPRDLVVTDNPAPEVRSHPRRPRGRWSGWLPALALAALGVGLVAAFGGVGPLPYVAAVLTGFGVGLVISSRRRRPPLLLPATLIAAIATTSLLFPVHPGKVGSFSDSYTTGAQIPGQIQYSAGDVRLDFSKLSLAEDKSVTIDVGAGQVDLVLPKNVRSQLVWSVGAGEYSDPGSPSISGAGISGSLGTDAPADAPTLTINLKVGVGEVKVVQ